MIKDTVKIIDVQQYIFQKTGTMVSDYQIWKWIKAGELPLVKPRDKDKRYRWTLKRYINQLIERYSE